MEQRLGLRRGHGLSGQRGNVRADVAAPGTTGLMLVTPPGAPASIPRYPRQRGAEIGAIDLCQPRGQDDAIRAEPDEGSASHTSSPARRRSGVTTAASGSWCYGGSSRGCATLRRCSLGCAVALAVAAMADAPPTPARPAPARPGMGFVVWLVGLVGAAIVAVLIVLLAIMLGIITLGLAFAVLGIGFSLLGLAFTIFGCPCPTSARLWWRTWGRWIVDSLSRREERPLEPVAPPGEVGAEPGAAPRYRGRSPAAQCGHRGGVVIYGAARHPHPGLAHRRRGDAARLGSHVHGLRDAGRSEGTRPRSDSRIESGGAPGMVPTLVVPQRPCTNPQE